MCVVCVSESLLDFPGSAVSPHFNRVLTLRKFVGRLIAILPSWTDSATLGQANQRLNVSDIFGIFLKLSVFEIRLQPSFKLLRSQGIKGLVRDRRGLFRSP